MKTKSIHIVLAVVVCGLLSSCEYDTVRASRHISKMEVNYSGFSGLKISNAFNAYVTFSDTEEKIVIEANENLHDKVILEIEGNDLIVKLKKHTIVGGKVTLNVFITTKRITHFDISGASSLTLENALVAENASIELSGTSKFYGELHVNRLELDSKGVSRTRLFGSTRYLDASLRGSSELIDYDFNIDALDIRLSGASDAYLKVTESIDIRASGASVLNYKGNAVVNNKDLSGASKINKK